MIRVLPLPSDARFRCIGTMPPMDAATEQAVEAVWLESGAAPGLREDNMIVGVGRYDESGLEALKFSYRCYFAQTVHPKLFRKPLTALAVSGLVTCEGRLILGRRSDWVTQDPNILELVPSGSVDATTVDQDGAIDFKSQFDHELICELGVNEDAATGHQIVGLIEDDQLHVVDVVMRATLECSIGELMAAHSRLCDHEPEYEELIAVTGDEFRRMIDDGSERISAVSTAIFANFWAALE